MSASASRGGCAAQRESVRRRRRRSCGRGTLAAKSRMRQVHELFGGVLEQEMAAVGEGPDLGFRKAAPPAVQESRVEDPSPSGPTAGAWGRLAKGAELDRLDAARLFSGIAGDRAGCPGRSGGRPSGVPAVAHGEIGVHGLGRKRALREHSVVRRRQKRRRGRARMGTPLTEPRAIFRRHGRHVLAGGSPAACGIERDDRLHALGMAHGPAHADHAAPVVHDQGTGPVGARRSISLSRSSMRGTSGCRVACRRRACRKAHADMIGHDAAVSCRAGLSRARGSKKTSWDCRGP